MSTSLQPHGLYPCQAPLSMGFSRQEYWSGLPFPSPGDLPNPEIEPGSPELHAEILYHLSHQGRSMDRGAWRAIVHGPTQESDTTEAGIRIPLLVARVSAWQSRISGYP